MIEIKIDKSDEKKYIYQQVYDKIKSYIVEKRIDANEQLPSKRLLAEQLNISVNSVTTAYEQLLAEGYIYTIERAGYFVEKITDLHNKKASECVLPEDLREAENAKTGWLSFSHISVDACMFPWSNWMKSEQKAMKHNRAQIAELTHFQGPMQLRLEIAKLIALTRGVICEPEQIVIGAGTQSLIERLVSLYDKNTKIAIEDPGYRRFYHLIKRIGYHVEPIPLDHNGLNIHALHQSEAKIVFVTPSHQFPTGMIMPISRRNELLNWAAQNETRFIVEDDYDSEFKYETDHIPSLQSLDQNQQVVYTGSFSKTILPSLRISYMVLPFHLLRKYRARYADIMHEVSGINLYTLYYFIQDGLYQKHVRNMNKQYEKKRIQLIKRLKYTFKDQMEIIDVPAGLHFLTYMKTIKTYDEVKERAKEEKLEMYTLQRFNLTNQVESEQRLGIIIGFAAIQEERIEEAVYRLWRVFS